MALNLFRSRSKRYRFTQDGGPVPTAVVSAEDYMPAPAESLDTDPLKALFQQERFNLILQQKEQWTDHPKGQSICQQAEERLDSQLAIVPEGRASLLRTLTDLPDAELTDCPVSPFLLDIHAVTNARYQRFLDAGGYDDLSLWPESIWTHLIQMRDQTGRPGPRYWREGRHDRRFSDHPVVGLCWYEASAYARWIGQRLPTEAEWQLAASWRIRSETDVFYRFPWGDAMDRRKCNIWAAGTGTTVPVDEYEKGVAPNGVRQLVGNVWEWVDGELDLLTEEGVQIVGEMALKPARGGAFDTYFESQCTSLFRSGYTALTRAHNVGFRCALSLADALWLSRSG